MKKYIFILLVFLNVSCVMGQIVMQDSLQQSFRNYQLRSPQEKLFIHTDKTFYLAGETIWFKVYLIDAAFHKPVDLSSISYIEILDAGHKSVLQAKVSMKKGNGNGYLIIPGFLQSGNYTLRGYTNWMRNFSPEFYYDQQLVIVNTQKRFHSDVADKQPATVQFFPEGGNLIAGFSNRVAFKAVDNRGMGITCKGFILNQANDTILSFQSVHGGMGSFYFKPEKNSSYYAVMRLNDSLLKQKLPNAEDRGFCMNLRADDWGVVTVIVHATADYENTDVYFFTQTRQIAKNVQTQKMIHGTATFHLNKKELGDGISTVTVFDAQRRPVCERLLFKRQEKNLSIQATADHTVYVKRTPVNIDLLTSCGNQLTEGNLSASVFRVDALQKIPEQDIVSWLYLSSDLKGTIESPEYYFTNTDSNTEEALDNLLLTQGWRRFNWRDILSGKKPVFDFIPELEGPVVTGKMVNKTNGVAAAEKNAFLSVPGADYAFNVSGSDENGMFRFAFKNIQYNSALVVQPALKKDSDYRMDIKPVWSEEFSDRRMNSLILSKNQQNELLNRSVDNQIENSYALENKRRYVKINPDTSSFFGKPDKSYYLDDYVRYQTMEEVLREFVIDVRVRKEGEKFNLRVKNMETDLYFEGYPLILLDGIPIDDASRLVKLDPLKIKKIELIAHQYYMGSFRFDGIINVKSYDSEIGSTQIDSNATVIEYQGIQIQREFYSPSYASEEAKQSRLPDFRNVLYWAPQVITGSDGKAHLSFYTSDVPGKFIAFIQGMSADGVPGKSIVQFEVKDSK